MGREQRTHKNHGNARCIMKRIKSRMKCQEDSIPARVNPTGGHWNQELPPCQRPAGEKITLAELLNYRLLAQALMAVHFDR